MFVNVLLAMLVLSIIVIAHEFGHFIIAKANGITVVEFCLGFGPKIVHFKKGETDYSIKLLPFGGACIMLGDEFLEMTYLQEHDDDDEEVSDAQKKERLAKLAEENSFDMSKSFSKKSVWARIAVIAAGPIFNFILAFICAVVIVGVTGYDPCDIDKVYDNSPASEAGLQAGDLITKVNGQSISFYRDYNFYRYFHEEDTMNITYKRDGKTYKTTLTPEHIKQQKYQVGITINENCGIAYVGAGYPADEAGVKAGDVIVSINGTAMESNSQITDAITESKGNKISMVVKRDGEEVTFEITPKLNEIESYYTGLSIYGDRVKVSSLETIKYSFGEVGYEIKSVILSLGMMFNGKVGVNDLMGPVGTVSTMSEIVEESKQDGTLYVILNLFNLAALISANLGVMNLLPIPALDGGRLVFLFIEALRGKPVKKEHEGVVHFVGMVLLALLMVYVMIKDIVGLF